MSIWQQIRRKLMLYKQYIGRTTTYLSIINAGMILYLFLSKLKEVGIIDWPIEQYAIWIVVIGVLILLFIGWFEIKILRGVHEENRISFYFTPPQVEMKEKIDEMYADFKKKKEAEHGNV